MTKQHTTEEFISKANLIHNNKYLYDEVVYKNNQTKVVIVCREHGGFPQAPNKHLHGRGCPKCADVARGLKRRLDPIIVEEAFISAGFTLQESYKVSSKPLKFICDNGHMGKISYSNLMMGHRCKICSKRRITDTQRTDYKKVSESFSEVGYKLVSKEYANNKTKLDYLCPVHGLRSICYSDLLSGRRCNLCNHVSRGEDRLLKFFVDKGIPFVKEKSYKGLKSDKGRRLRFDFEILVNQSPLLIEFHGVQHYEPVERFGGEEAFNRRRIHDQRKELWASEHKIPLLVIKYDQIKDIETLVENFIKSHLTASQVLRGVVGINSYFE